MKRLILLISFVIVFLILLNFVFAEDIPMPAAPTTGNSTNKTTASNLKSNFTDRTNKFLQTKMEVPESLKPLARLVFGIKEEVDFSTLVVLVILWISLLVIIAKILEFVPFFDSTAFRWIAAVCVTLLASMGGALLVTTQFLFTIFDFGALQKYGLLKFILSIIICIIIFFGVDITLTKILNNLRREEANVKGQRAGEGASLISSQGRSFKKAFDKH